MNTTNILDYIVQQTGVKPKKYGNKVLLNPCPVCGHRDHFYVYLNSNSYYSFAGCCKGGSLQNWLVEYEGLSIADAKHYVHSKIEPSTQAKKHENHELAQLLLSKLDCFYNECVYQYKLFNELETDFRKIGVDFTDPVYRYIRQAVRFYDMVTNKFITGDFKTRVSLMQNHKSEYFYKLNIGADGC